MSHYWVIAPVESNPPERFDKVWQFDLANNLISIGWEALGDISKMSREEISKAIGTAYPDKPLATKGLIVNMLWAFWHEIRQGDFVIARRGRTVLAAVGKVVSTGFYAPGKNPLLASPNYAHHGFLEVEWQQQPRNKNFEKVVFPMQTLKSISEVEYQTFVEANSIPSGPPLSSEPAGAAEDSSAFALEKHLEDFIVSNFKTIFKGELLMYEDGAGADGQQYITDIGPIDILAFEPRSKSFVVIELKRDRTSDQVIGQILRYMGWVRKELCKDGQAVRGLIICHDADRKLSYALEMTNNIDVQYYEVNFKLRGKPLMSDEPTPIVVRVDRQPAAKFVVIVDNQAFPNLSLNDGELVEPELRTLLADKYRLSTSEIEALIRQAKANPAVKPTPVQKR